MRINRNDSPRNFFAFLAIGLIFASAPAQPVDTTLSLSPRAVAADTAFRLSVFFNNFNCTDAFLHQTVSHDSGALYLSFEAISDSLKGCGNTTGPFGPTFDIPALAKGRYKVMIAQYPPCAFTVPICPIALLERNAGTLVVGDMGWFIDKPTVNTGDSITLHLLDQAYGNCFNGFEHATFNVANGMISTSFVIAEYPARDCLVNLHPAGPSFRLPPLSAGRYPVSVQIMPACMYANPPQPLCEIGPGGQVVDTLVVASGTPLWPVSKIRKGFSDPSINPSVRADGRKSVVGLQTLPGRLRE